MSGNPFEIGIRHKKSITTVEVLANCVELTKAIMRGVVGNEVADTMNTQPITDAMYSTIIASEIRKNLSSKTGV